MGIYEREYYQPESRTGFGSSIALWPWTYRLIAFNVAIFVIDKMSNDTLTEWGAFQTELAIFHFQVWRFFTFQFLHANINHLFCNMLGLFCFATVVESELGRRPFLGLYLLSGISGSVLYAILNLAGVLGGGYLVGASAGVLGVIVACAVIAPNMQVLLMFVFPIQLKVLAIISVGLSALYLLTQAANAGGEAAHLGGAAVGFVLIKNRRWLAIFDDFRVSRRAGDRKFSIPSLSSLLPDRSVADEELDRILDKIQEHGLDSLTSREKSTLKRASKERRDRQRRY